MRVCVGVCGCEGEGERGGGGARTHEGELGRVLRDRGLAEHAERALRLR